MSTNTATDTAPAANDASVRGAWRVVAEREIMTSIKAKSFRYSILVLVASIVALVVIASLLGGRPTDYKVGVVDQQGAAIVKAAGPSIDRADEGSTVDSRSFDSAKAAEQAVRDGDIDAALVKTDGGYEVIGDNEIDATLSTALTSIASQQALDRNAEAQGVDLEQLVAGSTVSERLLDPDTKDAGPRKVTAMVFVVLFYLTAVMFGMTIAQSVVQEKESRVVEILAAAVPIRALLWGKIVGNTLLALFQIVVMVTAGIVALALTGETELLSAIGPAAGWYVVFFVLGFVALAGLWAVAGSLASRQEDLGSTTMPGQILLFAPYILSIVGGASIKTVISMMPVMSAMVMPARMAEGGVPAWQIGVALAVNVIGAVLLVRFAARLYERTLMRTERKIGFGEALRING